MRPLWDMLHPGRPWADKLKPNIKSADSLAAEALQYLAERYPVIARWGVSRTYTAIDPFDTNEL